MTEFEPAAPRGRGATRDLPNRFERLHLELDEPPAGRVPTILLRDAARTIIARNDSPDIPFDASINPYRGCEHGCAYCYARPTHEYLGFSPGLEFETRILVKERAPELLKDELGRRNWEPRVLALSGVTDPYQPIERRLRLTRRCLEVLAEFRNPVAVITKNELVTRDLDLLAELARHDAAAVSLSVTTLDPALTGRMEPRTSRPERRLAAIRKLTDAGVPAGVMVAPIVPGLTEHELPEILSAARDAGAVRAGYVTLRLPGAVAPLFEQWLERHFPDRKNKVLNRLRDLHDGDLYRPEFGQRMRGTGEWARQIEALFDSVCRRVGLARAFTPLNTAAFRRRGQQLLLLE